MRSLQPGSYGALTIKPGAVLQLTSGVYFFDSLAGHRDSEIEIIDSEGPVVLYVKGSVDYQSKMEGTDAESRFLLVALTSGLVNIDSPFRGTVFAPSAQLRLSPVDDTGHSGAFFGRTLEVGARNPIIFVPFAHWGYLFPPKITFDCHVRATMAWASALFSYEGQLDRSARISEGSENRLEAEHLYGEPKTLFGTGVHEKLVWVRYGGPTLKWTVAGQTIEVDMNSRHCEMEDLQPVPSDIVTQTPASGYVDDINCENGDASCGSPEIVELPPGNVSFDAAYWPVVPPPPVEPFLINFTHLRGGDDGASGGAPEEGLAVQLFQPSAIVDDYIAGRREYISNDPAKNAQQPYYKSNIDMNQYCDNSGSHSCPDQQVVLPLVPGRSIAYFTFYDYRDLNYADFEIQVWFEVNTDGTGSVLSIQDRNWRTLSFSMLCPGVACACATANDWNACWKLHLPVPSPKAKLCAMWKTQTVDSKFGEDELRGRWLAPGEAFDGVQYIPASFALAKLVANGAAAYSTWSSYIPLDVEGCVPEELSPTVSQIVLGSDLQLNIAGIIGTPDNVSIQVLRDVESNVDADADGLSVDAETFVQVSKFEYRTDRLVYLSPALTDMTRSAAIASRAAMLQATGRDMGLVRDQIVRISADSPEASEGGSAFFSGKALHLRGRRAFEDGKVKNMDSSLKDVWAHEFGHVVQYHGLKKRFPVMPYGYKVQVEDASEPTGLATEVQDDPDWAPPTCRCDAEQNRFLTGHCIKSWEYPAVAQVEGYGSAYGARFYNRTDESDCFVPYAKYSLASSCPFFGSEADEKVKCHPLKDMTRESFEAFLVAHDMAAPVGIDPDDLKRKYLDWDILQEWSAAEGAELVILEAPVILSCSEASKWRNNQCFDASVASDIFVNGGNELDWLQFYWGLMSEGVNPTGPWTVTDTFVPYNILCDALGGCSYVPAEDVNGDPILIPNNATPPKMVQQIDHVDLRWPNLVGAVVEGRVRGSLSLPQVERFELMGRNYGVDTDGSP